MEKVACYIRVSTEEQKIRGLSLDAQEDILKSYAQKHNLLIYDFYKDEGVSGRKLIKNRPELQRMIIDGESKKFDRIIFIKLDRFFRSVGEYYECMKRLGDIQWTATEEQYDLTTANGRMFVNMKLTIAELEADQTSERIKIVNEYKVREGKALVGKKSLPFGFTIQDKKVAHEQEEIVRDLIQFFLTCKTIGQTAKYGFKKYNLSYWRISTLLHSPLLIGRYRDNPNFCEAYVTDSEYEEIQRILNSRERFGGDAIYHYLFKGVVRCPECHTMLQGYLQIKTINGVTYTNKAYRCQKHIQGNCSYSKSIYENRLLKLVMEKLDDFQVEAEIYDDRTDEKEKLKKELDRLTYAFQKGRISVENYDTNYERLTNEIASIKEKKQPQIKNALSENWKEAFELLNEENKNFFFRSLFEYIEPVGEGRKKSIYVVYK